MIKWFLLLIIVLLMANLWILPRTRLSKYFKSSVRLFYVFHVLMVLCGFLGMVLSFVMPERILSAHYFELILLPVLFVAVYELTMRRVRKNVEPYDEKQDANMNKAAALSWLFSLVAAFFLYLLFREEVLAGLVWFPLLVFFAITAYAVSTLFLFIRN